jgi:hypothetical protein
MRHRTSAWWPRSDSSDKLAQRNIAWIDGPNPGAAVASRRMPHPIQVRPTPPTAQDPDELLILWGNTPKTSVATLYVPALDAAEIIHLADRRYATHRLEFSDAHTITCPAEGATLIPMPTGSALAAGLLSVELPTGIRKGDLYSIDIRQLTNAAATFRSPPQIEARPRRRGATATPAPTSITWRRVLGGSRFAIAISTKQQLLLPEERLLAILRWMAQQMPPTKRWYPVLLRYIWEVAGRVDGFGGNPSTIGPSPTGHVPGWPAQLMGDHHHDHDHDYDQICGTIDAIVYDHFGDFEGFIVETETGRHHRFHSHDEPMLRVARAAMNDRAPVTVVSEHDDPRRARRIIVRAGRGPRH